MKSLTASLLILSSVLYANSSIPKTDQPPRFEDAIVLQVNHIQGDLTLICDIQDFPPIVGKNMPVKIRGIEAPQSAEKSELKAFLQEILDSAPVIDDPNQPPYCIQLKNLQRGTAFCLIADVHINGQDLGDLLVKESLVKRILKVPPASSIGHGPESILTTPTQQHRIQIKPLQAPPAKSGNFIASKTSKIYHRPSCYHVRRISDEKKVTFHTKQQAENSNRRPCKTCNP